MSQYKPLGLWLWVTFIAMFMNSSVKMRGSNSINWSGIVERAIYYSSV